MHPVISVYIYVMCFIVDRSQHHRMYKLKTRLRLAEMWVSETVEPALPSDDSRFAFTIGWPIINCTAVFR